MTARASANRIRESSGAVENTFLSVRLLSKDFRKLENVSLEEECEVGAHAWYALSPAESAAGGK